MKKDIAEYVAVCDVCQRVKAEHQKPAGLLQPLPIPEWKWDKLGMEAKAREMSRLDARAAVMCYRNDGIFS